MVTFQNKLLRLLYKRWTYPEHLFSLFKSLFLRTSQFHRSCLINGFVSCCIACQFEPSGNYIESTFTSPWTCSFVTFQMIFFSFSTVRVFLSLTLLWGFWCSLHLNIFHTFKFAHEKNTKYVEFNTYIHSIEMKCGSFHLSDYKKNPSKEFFLYMKFIEF